MVSIPGQPPPPLYDHHSKPLYHYTHSQHCTLPLYETDCCFATCSQVQTNDENKKYTGSIKILNYEYIANIRNTTMLAPRRTGRNLGTGYKIRTYLRTFLKPLIFLKVTYKISMGWFRNHEISNWPESENQTRLTNNQVRVKSELKSRGKCSVWWIY